MDTKKEQKGWTNDELEASVDAYLAIQARYPNDEKFNKSAEHKLLQGGVLASRNTKSIDYRLQNISALFDELGLKPIIHYKPKVNIGSGIAARLTKILETKGLLTQSTELLATEGDVRSRHVKPAKAQNFVDVPEDDSPPQQGVTVTRYFVRNSKIKGWILENAKGICEACDQPGPFEMDGKPYLEVHHVKHLAQQGKDRKNNTVALCPNCHRRCHHSSDRVEFTDSLYKKVKRLKRQ
ncbi:HNH endonuclease [Pseudomonas koreensis]|uniref:HNH endonuclease n=1 Tax=Pseudomonas koreensis TaxID=198620 RepID=A0A9X2XG19_9PSED|nr:HNH endonuclease signature motif containing protein [Pseudomonas koreensis]MCU7248295.1 HNH endonuclease [Pseudomonas koreensis]